MQRETKQAFVDTLVQLITHLSGPRSNISGGKKTSCKCSLLFPFQRCCSILWGRGRGAISDTVLRHSQSCPGLFVDVGQRALAALKCAEHQTITNGTKMWSTKTQREGCLCNQSGCLNHHMIECWAGGSSFNSTYRRQLGMLMLYIHQKGCWTHLCC